MTMSDPTVHTKLCRELNHAGTLCFGECVSYTDYHGERAAVEALFGQTRHVPYLVVCSDCHHGPGFLDIAHSSGGGEDAVCLWPCNHEVQPGDPRCLACTPLRNDERDPWESICSAVYTTYYSTPGICARPPGHAGDHARHGEPGWVANQ